MSLTLLRIDRSPDRPDEKSGCQIVLSIDRHQFAGTALAMKHRAGDRVISCDLLNRVLAGADGEYARRYIDVVEAWGASCRADHDEDLRQNHWRAAVYEIPGSDNGGKPCVCIAIGRTSTKTPEEGSSTALRGG
jgi:hypothetical protein